MTSLWYNQVCPRCEAPEGLLPQEDYDNFANGRGSVACVGEVMVGPITMSSKYVCCLLYYHILRFRCSQNSYGNGTSTAMVKPSPLLCRNFRVY